MTPKSLTSRRTRRNVGVIGLGIIGSRVAENLRHRGFHAFVWNRTPRSVPNFVGSPGEVAELCDFVQIFVSDDDALLQMIQRMTSKLTPQHIIMAHSTVAPDTMRAAAEIVERRGARLLDVPFTGSKGAAEKAELIYYVGGDGATLAEARPVLAASSKEIVEIGVVGQASAMKIATNIITAAVVQGAAEALALVADAGLAPEQFQLAMRSNGSNSATLEMKLPKMLAGDFGPQFSVKHMLKDMEIASRMARIAGVELGVVDAARRLLAAEQREGRGDSDYSSVVRNYFPEGLPLRARNGEATGGGDEHPTFAGLDESPAPASKGAAEEVEPDSTHGPEAVTEGAAEESKPDESNSEPRPKAEEITPAQGPPATPPSVPDPKIEEPSTVVSNSADVEKSDEVLVEETSTAEKIEPLPDKTAEPAGMFRRFFRRGSED